MSERRKTSFMEGTHRDWRAKKRREWRAAVKAMESFKIGCAYTPVYNKYVQILQLMDEVTRELRGDWKK